MDTFSFWLNPEQVLESSCGFGVPRMSKPSKRFSRGCSRAYSALHNTVMGIGLVEQLKGVGLCSQAVVGVAGGRAIFPAFFLHSSNGLRERLSY